MLILNNWKEDIDAATNHTWFIYRPSLSQTL